MPDAPIDPPTPSPAHEAVPTALLRPVRARTPVLPFLIPVGAVIVALILVGQSILSRGPGLTLTFPDGHGLKPDDPVVFRGVQVGRVRDLGVTPDARVSIRIELARDAAFLATGTCFWIVRPELSLSRISGLETLLGPRYIAVAEIPEGESSPVAREAPPPFTWYSELRPGTPGAPLLVNIRTPRAGSLAAGSPVSYRELPVGSVVAVSLAADGRTVLITAAIRDEHRHLVRTTSVFWNVSGIGLDLGFVGGIKLKAESLQTVLAGGLAFATPESDQPAPLAEPGAEFPLGEFDSDFLRWAPDLSQISK